jgi:putative membrane protein
MMDNTVLSNIDETLIVERLDSMGLFLNMIRGFCMALADSVPGVSGGTIAFVLGFYDEFIGALYLLTHGGKNMKRHALLFLGKLGIGWVIGMASSVVVLGSLFTTHIYELSSLFLGLSIFSLPLIARDEKKALRQHSRLVYMIIGIVLVLVITYFNPTSGQGTNVEISHLTPALALYIFVCAMIAICAMVLPGISGSTMLLIFGLYVPVISAVREFLHMNLSYFPVLALFGSGVIAGIIGIIRIVKNALEKHHAAMVYFIIGLMVGSLYAIVMGPTTLKIPQPAMTLETFSPLCFLLGGALLAALNGLRRFSEKKLHPEEEA